MSQATESLRLPRAPHIRVVGAVSAAHFVSHYYIIILAPLLPFVRADYGISYTEIGVAIAAFNIVSAVLQTPAGFLVDWLGARMLLVAGLIIGAAAFVVVGLTTSYWLFFAMFALAGVGNTVYHPAHYALLSHHVPNKHIGQAFSVHTFAGMLGSAVAPASLLMMQSVWGWRGAFIGAGVIGFVVAAILLAIREEPVVSKTAATANEDAPKDVASWKLLLSAPILLNLLFFVLLAMTSGGLYNYSVVALGMLFGTPVTVANAALSANLLWSALGVLAGGLLVTRTTWHGAVAGISLFAMALLTALVGQIDLGSLLLIVVMSAAGFFSGVMMPSRDMIVREVTPPGAFGRVFGFVTTGFNIGGVISPLIFGAIMDHGNPRLIFLGVAVFSLLGILPVAALPRRPA